MRTHIVTASAIVCLSSAASLVAVAADCTIYCLGRYIEPRPGAGQCKIVDDQCVPNNDAGKRPCANGIVKDVIVRHDQCLGPGRGDTTCIIGKTDISINVSFHYCNRLSPSTCYCYVDQLGTERVSDVDSCATKPCGG